MLTQQAIIDFCDQYDYDIRKSGKRYILLNENKEYDFSTDAPMYGPWDSVVFGFKTEKFIKELHYVLKNGTGDSRKDWFCVIGFCFRRNLFPFILLAISDIFLGRYYFVYPVEQIAKQLGLSENYVRNILSRTRRKLQHYLEKEGYSI